MIETGSRGYAWTKGWIEFEAPNAQGAWSIAGRKAAEERMKRVPIRYPLPFACGRLAGVSFAPAGAGLVGCGLVSHGVRHGIKSFAPLRGLDDAGMAGKAAAQTEDGSRPPLRARGWARSDRVMAVAAVHDRRHFVV